VQRRERTPVIGQHTAMLAAGTVTPDFVGGKIQHELGQHRVV